MTNWLGRLLGETQLRLLALLRRRSQTITSLAQALGLTDNGVRAHVATLERDGLVADVGAGKGRFTVDLARSVGEGGRVFATEVDAADIETIKETVAAERLENVTVVLGDQQQTGLPQACCDAILLRLVYHHFTDPAAMRRSLWRALQPGGRIAVIDVPPQPGWRKLEGVPERGGHGIAIEELVADMRAQGFEVAARHDTWPAVMRR